MRRTIALAATLAIALSSAGASLAAAPCRDAKGKFIKCPAPAAAATAKPASCKDGKGKFVKCGTPGAKPA